MVKREAEQERKSAKPLRTFARAMRHEPTDAERKFWSAVRGRHFAGHKFKRQFPVGPFIADFVCLERHLIIELDGGQHTLQLAYDADRTAYLEAKGFRVFRMTNFSKNRTSSSTQFFAH